MCSDVQDVPVWELPLSNLEAPYLRPETRLPDFETRFSNLGDSFSEA
jgi:hypothetical protein